MTQLLWPFLCQALLGLACLRALGLAVEVKVPAEPLSTPVGRTAELTCSYSTSVGDSFALEWSFAPPGTPVSAAHPILYFTNGHLYPTGSKARRASLLQNPPTGGVATLTLTDVHPSDTGTYLCQVNNPPDFYTNGLGLINFTVLVPPSTPLCSQSGLFAVGGAAALRCSSSEGAPKPPVYNWVRLGPSPTPPPGSMVQDQASGQLTLTNLSLASSGTYRCVATNQMGTASCELTLSVSGPSKGRVAGALIGVLLGVLLLSVAAFCLTRFQRERRKPEETYGGSDLWEDAMAPGTLGTSARAGSSHRLLERPPAASTRTQAPAGGCPGTGAGPQPEDRAGRGGLALRSPQALGVCTRGRAAESGGAAAGKCGVGTSFPIRAGAGSTRPPESLLPLSPRPGPEVLGAAGAEQQTGEPLGPGGERAGLATPKAPGQRRPGCMLAGGCERLERDVGGSRGDGRAGPQETGTERLRRRVPGKGSPGARGLRKLAGRGSRTRQGSLVAATGTRHPSVLRN
ncbi:V-set and immunoglobulin domain-containing protein 2 [Tupaia chinensis]|uniref:V-set and immunoglobulin domain-containing protein 2 n=1 Tax=Tupaia chinensis TaxID=246437 RepID=UPI000FFBA071|nr:V-set and immunoglobulin domain-containing protein 2 [Tupaia chinensis]